MKRLSASAARRIALGAQGFNDPRPAGSVSIRHYRRVLDRMSILQLDSVNVLTRSHYLPVLARIGPYDRAKLDHFLYRSGENFEFLSHEASITSQELLPLLRWRMTYRWKKGAALEAEAGDYVAAVLDEVRQRGPLSVKDLSDPGERTGPWWGQSKGKVALELLYVTGRLAIRERTSSFVTVYDLPERVIGADHLAAPVIDEAVAAKKLLMIGARSHGIGTGADIADYFRLRMPVARPLLAELVAEGALVEVEVDGWDEPALLHPEAKRPRVINGRALLSPFDPVVWFRPRAERLFNFHYRIEIYVPEAKRTYGYYVLPFLLDGNLVARVDLKADRQAGVLRVRGSYAESAGASGADLVRAGPGAGDRQGADLDYLCEQLAEALSELATWLDLDGVDVEPNGDLATPLARAV